MKMDLRKLSGEVRRFGAIGPLYEVLGEAPADAGGERVRIRVAESGEEAEYPVAQMLRDPVAA